MSTKTIEYEVEETDETVLLKVVRQGVAGSHTEGIRIPFDLIEDAIQALTDAAREGGYDL